MLTTLLLSRIQFAFTISMHILFPAFSIGLATFLAIMEGMWFISRDKVYLEICQFWMKIFALTFGMGVVSGIVMEFQLGTNWSMMTNMIGDVLGALFTYEVLTAFFIEAGFLGVMIFGWNKVGPRLHYAATLLVTLGVTLSAFWIMAANSWMQTPSGATFLNGRFVVDHYHDVIFNPSTTVRFIHMLLASYITTLFVIAGVAAFYLQRKQHEMVAKTCLSFAMWALLILVPLQVMMGDEAGLIIHQYQPIKTAAIEAAWQTQSGAPLVLFAWPDMASGSNLYSLAIPHLASLINTHEWNGVLTGLDTVSPADQPYVPFVFFSFRIMVGVGILMLLIALWALFLRLRRRLFVSRVFLKTCLYFSPMGFVALWCGWITAETGRQPWVVYHLLRTSDAVSPISVKDVIISFSLIVIVYGLIFGVFYFRYFIKIIKTGPKVLSADTMPFGYMAQHSSDEEIKRGGTML